MTDADLDQTYTALCRALGDVGEERARVFLAMLSLALLARAERAQEVLPVIAQVRDRCLQETAASVSERTDAG